MNFNKKQFTFRPNGEIIKGLEQFYEENKRIIPLKNENDEPTTADLFEIIILKANQVKENNLCESEIIEELKKTLEAQISTNEHLGAAYQKKQEEANENGRIATNLQLEVEKLKTQLENNNSDVQELFSDENKFMLWQMLQVFRQIYPNWSFENMIIFIITSFRENGYLKLDKKDISYLETINGEYHGNL